MILALLISTEPIVLSVSADTSHHESTFFFLSDPILYNINHKKSQCNVTVIHQVFKYIGKYTESVLQIDVHIFPVYVCILCIEC